MSGAATVYAIDLTKVSTITVAQLATIIASAGLAVSQDKYALLSPDVQAFLKPVSIPMPPSE